MLFVAPDRHAEFLAHLKSGERTALALNDALRAAAMERAPQPGAINTGDRANTELARVCLAWVEGDTAMAERARGALLELLAPPDKSDLGKAGSTLALVLALEFGTGLWSAPARAEVLDRIAQKARDFLTVLPGNPHDITNNWWALTHGGCLLACLAAHGQTGLNGTIDLAELREWSLQRLRMFCAHFGNAGLYHEGTGYIAYTLSMLMPVAVALRNAIGFDLLEEFPQLGRSTASMFAACASIRHLGDKLAADGSGYEWIDGAVLQWNDTGRGCASLNPLIPGIALAPSAWQGALRTLFDRLVGVDGPARFVCAYRGLPLAVALYPFSAAPVDPEGVIPKAVLDHRHGLGFWRNRWGSGDETVLGWYARTTHAGCGHSHDDAGSIRLISHGRTWICGGGQARDKAIFQSVFTHADPSQRPSPRPNAAITSSHFERDRGVVAMDMRRVLKAYGERYLAWNTGLKSGTCALTLLDLLDDHLTPPRDWLWNLSFPRELDAHIHADSAGFSLRDPALGTLTARFVVDRPDAIAVESMPDSTRTFANGEKVRFAGDRYISARFDARRRATVLVAMLITRTADEPAPDAITWSEGALHAPGLSWPAPFAPAILSSVRLGASHPNLMNRPAG